MTKDSLSQFQKISGMAGYYYKNLITGEEIEYHGTMAFEAASVIKIPVMIEYFYQVSEGRIDPDHVIKIKAKDLMPGCGVITYLNHLREVTLSDLCRLMIIVSDNTATNLLIDVLKIVNINQRMASLGMTTTRLNRFLFDGEKSALGIQNYISPKEIGKLLEMMYDKTLISKNDSKAMIEILKNQQLNGKIPFYVTDDIEIAHKTGEDEQITHDAAIVYTRTPFILVFCTEKVDVPAAELMMQTISRQLISIHDAE